MKYEKLQTKIADWAEDRNIFASSTPLAQLSKTQEELDETKAALLKHREGGNAFFEVADGIGDMMVTIIILAEMCGMSSVECLQLAYDEIKDRKGQMIDGLFVKED